jgi:hypothetical protein
MGATMKELDKYVETIAGTDGVLKQEMLDAAEALQLEGDKFMTIKNMIESASSEHLVQTTRKLIAYLLKIRIAQSFDIPSEIVGVHPDNRDGQGCSWQDVYDLLDLIIDVGWSDEEVQAICISISQKDRCKIVQFNEQLVEASGGHLAPISTPLRYASLAASHTNQVIRVVLASCKHSNPKATDNGRLSVSKVSAHDHEFGGRLKTGLKWISVPAELFVLFPQLADRIQSAYNAGSHAANKEGQVQIMMRLYREWSKRAGDGTTVVDFPVLRDAILKSNPPCKKQVPYMYSLMLKIAGGVDGWALKQDSYFIRSRASASRKVSGEFYQAAADDFKGEEQHVFLRRAAYRVAMTTQINVVNEETTFMVASDVKRLHHIDIASIVTEATTIIRDIRKLVANNEHLWTDDQKPKDCVLVCENNMLLIVLKKSHKDLTLPATLSDAAYTCIQQINDSMGVAIQSPWPAPTESLPSTGSKPAVAPMHTPLMRTFDVSSGAVDCNHLLRTLGFAYGELVKRKSDNLVAKIIAAGPEGVTLQLACDAGACKSEKVSIEEFFAKKWVNYNTAPQVEIVEDLMALNPVGSEDFKLASHKGAIIQEIFNLSTKHQNNLKSLRVQMKPKKVWVTAAMQKGQLCLVPSTFNVKAAPEKLSTNAVLATIKGVAGSFVLAQFSSQDGRICPYWYVNGDGECPNMAVSWYSNPASGVSVPMLVNTSALKAGELLSLGKAGAMADTTTAEATPKAKAEAKGKAKAKAKAVAGATALATTAAEAGAMAKAEPPNKKKRKA